MQVIEDARILGSRARVTKVPGRKESKSTHTQDNSTCFATSAHCFDPFDPQPTVACFSRADVRAVFGDIPTGAESSHAESHPANPRPRHPSHRGVCRQRRPSEFFRRMEAECRTEQFRSDAGADDADPDDYARDPSLKIVIAQTGAFDFNADFWYTTDGKECPNQLNDFKMTSVVTWDGARCRSTAKWTFRATR